MIKYYFFIIFGIILYLLSNLHEKFEAVEACNCRDSDDQPIYDRDNCENIGMTEVASYSQEPPRRIPRFNSNGMPCVYTNPLQFMYDSVIVDERVCERDSTNLSCMIQFYDSIGGSCQINTLYLYYLFIGFPLTSDDIEWLNRFNFFLPIIYIRTYVNNYLLNRSIMRDTLYSLRLNPNNLRFKELDITDLRVNNLYQIDIIFKINKNRNQLFGPPNFTFNHALLLYVATIEEVQNFSQTNSHSDIDTNLEILQRHRSDYNERCLIIIDGCHKKFNLLLFTLDEITNPFRELNLQILWYYIKDDLTSTSDIPITKEYFFQEYDTRFFSFKIAVLYLDTLNEDESIPEKGETGFIDKFCNIDGSCNNFNFEIDYDQLVCGRIKGKKDKPDEYRCVVQNTEFQFCDPNEPCNNPDFACIVDNDYGGFEHSFYHSELGMTKEVIDSDIAKSNPKCLPTGRNYRPCDSDRKCIDGLACVNIEERDSLGKPKLPICIREESTQCAANTTCNIM